MSAAPPVVLLCGGQGTRIREQAPHLPKPMVEVGGKPLLWHILRHYAAHGHRRFVLCLGHLGEVIRAWAAADPLPGLQIELVDTGVHAMTGARLRRVAGRLGGAPRFHLTYGDAVSDVDLTALAAFHAAHGRLVTVTGVHPPARFGQLLLDGSRVRAFHEKPQVTDTFINGGFFVLERAALDRLWDDDGCTFEHEPLEGLARDGELQAFLHPGFWQCMDTPRDWRLLDELWAQGRAPWLP